MATAEAHPHDPRGLIREAYRIDGIGAADCRSIFFDWALGLPADTDPAAAARALMEHHAAEPADHPMTVLLREAAEGRADGAGGRRRRARPR